jgi:hypothetical protein
MMFTQVLQIINTDYLSAITCFSIIMTLLFCFFTINPRLKNVNENLLFIMERLKTLILHRI